MLIVDTLRRMALTTTFTACVLAIPNVARGQGTDLRPVDPAANPPSLSERAKGAEASIPITIQRSLKGDAELAPYDIKVAGNERRNITLSGTVPTTALRDKAERIARETSGTQHVHNDIVVTSHPSERRGDDAATTNRSDPARVMPERE